jgi:hypothetical protein
MAAISQIRHKRSQGRAYYDKKLAEGKTHKEATGNLSPACPRVRSRAGCLSR